jgi:phage gp46-like protein
MAQYWEGTVTVSGLMAGSYRAGAWLMLGPGTTDYHFALLEGFYDDGSGAPVTLQVRSRHDVAAYGGLDPNGIAVPVETVLRPYGTPQADGGPEVIPQAQATCTTVDISVAQVEGGSFTFTDYWEHLGGVYGWARPVRASFLGPGTLRIGWDEYTANLPTRDECPELWETSAYALSDASIVIYVVQEAWGNLVYSSQDRCLDLAIGGGTPGLRVIVTAPQFLLTSQGLWLQPAPAFETMDAIPVTIEQPVDVTVVLETDTPEARATVVQTLESVFSSLRRAESLPPSFANDCIAYFASVGIVIQSIAFSVTAPDSGMHRLVLGTITFEGASAPPRPQAGTDVRLFHTADGGEIELARGSTMADGLETAVYLSLFGGNERDSGLSADDHLQWWGNLSELDQQRQYRSETQHLLRSLPAIPANLRRIEDALTRDLGWLTADIATKVTAVATIPRLNSIAIDVDVTMKTGTQYQFQFATGWSVPT